MDIVKELHHRAEEVNEVRELSIEERKGDEGNYMNIIGICRMSAASGFYGIFLGREEVNAKVYDRLKSEGFYLTDGINKSLATGYWKYPAKTCRDHKKDYCEKCILHISWKLR